MTMVIISLVLSVPLVLFCWSLYDGILIALKGRELQKLVQARAPNVWEEIGGNLFWWRLLDAKIANDEVPDESVEVAFVAFRRRRERRRWLTIATFATVGILVLLSYLAAYL